MRDKLFCGRHVGLARSCCRFATAVQDASASTLAVPPALPSAVKRNDSMLTRTMMSFRRWFGRPTSFLISDTGNLTGVAALHVQRCSSHISSFKEEGYYRLAHLRDIHVDENCYTLLAVRGGGPGGQGANSSSNKVELRAMIAALSECFDEELIHRLKDNERGKSLTSDEALIIISSHEHRSAHQNREACLQRLREMIQKASWVPPVEADPIKRPTGIITTVKAERWKKGSMRKMQRSARKGLW